MKKLIVALAAVAIGFGVQANTMSWKSGTLKINAETGSATTSASSVGSSVTATLYNIDASTYSTILALLVTGDSLNVDGMKTVYEKAKKGDYGTSVASGATSKGAKTLSDGADTYAEGTTYYALLTYEYKSGSPAEVKYVIASVGSYEMGATSGSLGSLGLKIGGDTGTVAIGQWAQVPEPTSGLLMLVGLGALALRRRRA